MAIPKRYRSRTLTRTAIVGGRLGALPARRSLFVVHTEAVDQENGRPVGRIISVRKATAGERKAYEEDIL
jgi:uncharacterized DUF497 family protein